MGSSQSTQSQSQWMDHCADLFVSTVLLKNKGIYGGDDTTPSAREKLNNTPVSLDQFARGEYKIYSERNIDLIRKIATCLQDVGFKIDNPSSSNIDALIENIRDKLPAPSRGKNIVPDLLKQDKILDALFEGVKKVTKSTYKATSAEDKYRYIVEILYSLFSGIHYEFLMAKKGIEMELERIKVCILEINNFNKRNHELLSEIESSDKSPESKEIAKSEMARNMDIVDKLSMFFNSSAEALENMLNVDIKNSDELLAEMAKKTDNTSLTIAQIAGVLNPVKRGVDIANGITQFGNLALMANEVSKALTKIGLTVNDIMKNSNLDQLRHMLEDKKINTSASQLIPLATAITYITDSFNNIKYNDALRKQVIANMSSSSVTTGAAESSSEADGAAEGGDYESEMSKNIKSFKRGKLALLTQFNRQLDYLFGQLNAVVTRIAKKIGTEQGIEVRDKTQDFIDAFGAIESFKESNVYYAISGYSKNLESKQKREKVLNQFKLIVITAEALATVSPAVKDLLKELVNVVNKIIEYMDIHFKVFDNNFALTGKVATGAYEGGAGDEGSTLNKVVEIGQRIVDQRDNIGKAASRIAKTIGTAVDELKEPAKDLKKSFDTITTGQGEDSDDEDSERVGGGVDLEIPAYILKKNVFAFDNTKALLKAYYRLGKFRHNLSVMGSENASNKEESLKILGITIGNLKSKVREEKEAIMKLLSSTTPESGCGYNPSDAADKLVIDQLKNFYEIVFTTKEGFYNVVEQIELILTNFINGVTKNPEAVTDLKQLIDNISTTSNWFDEDLGDELCKLFELFGHTNTNNTAASGITKGDLDVFNKAISSTSHYYAEVAAKVLAAGKDSLPATPFIAFPLSEANLKQFIDQCKTVAKKYDMIPNLLSIFRKIGDKFGKDDTTEDVSMSMISMSNALKNFIVFSSFIGFFNNSVTEFNTDGVDPIASQLFNKSATFNGFGTNNYAANVSRNTGGTDAAKIDANKLLNSMVFGSVDERYNLKGLGAKVNFAQELELFEMLFKAMVTKIFTTIGVFNIFERPLIPTSAISSVRLAIGGGVAMPKIYPEITSLYHRMLLLSELYREIFDIGHLGTRGISFVPDIDGVFGKLVELIYIKFDYIKEGQYSENDIKEYVQEVNNIYIFYSSKNKSVNSNSIIEDYIIEINRRYGVVKLEEYNRIVSLRNASETFNVTDHNSALKGLVIEDFEDEEDNTTGKLAPSALYYGRNFNNVNINRDLPDYANDLSGNIKIFNDFRHKLDLKINNFSEMAVDANIEAYSFDRSILQAQEDIKVAVSDEDKFRVLYRLLTMSDKFSKSSDMKVLMFHEIVLTPLATIIGLQTYLAHILEASILGKADGIIYDAIDGPMRLRQFVELLGSSEGLIDLKFSRDGVYADLSGLSNLVQTMLEDLINNVQKFNGNIDREFYDKTVARIKKVEFEFLQNQLLGKSNPNDKLQNKLNDFIKNIIASFRQVTDGGTLGILLTSALYCRNDSYNDQRNTIHFFRDENKLIKGAGLLSTCYDIVNHKLVYSEACQLVKFYYTSGTNDEMIYELPNPPAAGVYLGMIIEFNQYLYRYLNLFSDISNTSVTYLPLIDGFANGTFNSDILQETQVVNDLYGEVGKYGPDGELLLDPYQGAISKAFLKLGVTDINSPANRKIVADLFKTATDATRTLFNSQINNTIAPFNEFEAYYNAPGAFSVADVYGRDPNPANTFANQQNRIDAAITAVKVVRTNVYNRINLFLTDINDLLAIKIAVGNTQDAIDEIPAGVGPRVPGKIDSFLTIIGNPAAGLGISRVNGRGGGAVVEKLEFVHDYLNATNLLSFDRSLDRIRAALRTMTRATGVAGATYAANVVTPAVAIIDAELLNIKTIADGIMVSCVTGNLNTYITISEVISGNMGVKIGLGALGKTAIILKNDTLKDLDYNDIKAGFDNQGVLLKSLSYIIRKIITSVDTKGKKNRLTTDLTEVPLYLKERFRVHLPTFSKIFDNRIKQLETYKKFASFIYSDTIKYGVDSIGKNNKVTDKLIQGYYSLKNCATTVIRELDDKPKYLEVGQDSIIDYRNINKKLPFMPYSLQLNVLSDTFRVRVEDTCFPHVGLTGDVSKLLYGTRGLFNLPPSNLTYEAIPGVKNILDSYNTTVGDKASINPDDLLRILKTSQVAINQLVNTYLYNFAINKVRVDFAGKLRADLTRNIIIYSLDKSTSDVINCVESSFQNDKRDSMISYISNAAPIVKNRNQMRIINVLDMGIMPINIHALRRSIPLPSILNLSYSFDQMVAELLDIPQDTLGEFYKTGQKDINQSNSHKTFLFSLLTSPSKPIDIGTYNSYIDKFFRGDNGLPLVRPKFLGDQIYNKVLFGELYQDKDTLKGTNSTNSRPQVRYDDNTLKAELKPIFKMVLEKIYNGFLQKLGFDKYISATHFMFLDTVTGTGADNEDITVKPMFVNTMLELAYSKALTVDAQLKITSVFKDANFHTADGVTVVQGRGVVMYYGLISIMFIRAVLQSVKEEIQRGELYTIGLVSSILKAYLGDNMQDAASRSNGTSAIKLNGPGTNYLDVLNDAIFTAAPPKLDTAFLVGVPTPYVSRKRTPSTTLVAAANLFDPIILDAINGNVQRIYNGNSTYVDGQFITYPKFDSKTQKLELVPVDTLAAKNRGNLIAIGKTRFDTPLIRNTIFVSSLFRIIRYKLDKETKWYNPGDLITSWSALDSSLTEEYGNEVKP